MKKYISIYLLLLLIFYGWLLCESIGGKIVLKNENIQLALFCAIIGGIGGVTYCLRGIYLNVCVFKRWDDSWATWYYLRPIISFISGAISCLFLKAGIIVLEAQQNITSTYIAFYALAFIAGLNVDNFIEKIEDMVQVAWGIKQSRISLKDGQNGESKNSLP